MAKENNVVEKESKTDIAYRLLLKKKKEKNFYDIWEDVKNEARKQTTDPVELAKLDNDEDISFFYTNLTLDGRFVCVGDNKWTLRERVTFDKVHIDMNEIYGEEESDVSDIIEEEEDNSTADDYEDSYDDSTGTDADVIKYSAKAVEDEEEE